MDVTFGCQKYYFATYKKNDGPNIKVYFTQVLKIIYYLNRSNLIIFCKKKKKN